MTPRGGRRHTAGQCHVIPTDIHCSAMSSLWWIHTAHAIPLGQSCTHYLNEGILVTVAMPAPGLPHCHQPWSPLASTSPSLFPFISRLATSQKSSTIALQQGTNEHTFSNTGNIPTLHQPTVTVTTVTHTHWLPTVTDPHHLLQVSLVWWFAGSTHIARHCKMLWV